MQPNDNSRLIATVGYITWIGFIVALCISDKSDRFVAHHLNQSLVIKLAEIAAGVVTFVPLLGSAAAGIVGLACTVFWFIGIIRAIQGSAQPLPIIEEIHIID